MAYQPGLLAICGEETLEHFQVGLHREISQFAHLAQDGQFVRVLHHAKVFEGGGHAGQVGVVGIHDEGVVGRAEEFAAIVCGAIFGDGGIDVGIGHTEMYARTDGAKGIADIVRADELGGHTIPITARTAPTEAQAGVASHHFALNGILMARQSIGYGGQANCLTAQDVVLAVEEDVTTALAEVVVEFALRADYTLEGTKAFKVGHADVGDDATVSLHDATEVGNLAGMVGTRFNDGQLVLGAEAQEGFGHADVVVEVALGVEEAEFAAEDGGEKFLGGGLAVRTRHLEDGQGEFAAVAGCQLLHGRKDIVHEYIAVAMHHCGIVDHGIGTATFEGLGCKLIAIKVAALEREKDAVGNQSAGVGSHLGVRQKNLIKFIVLGHNMAYF